MKKRGINAGLFAVLIVVLFLLPLSSASEEIACAAASVTSITPSSIEIGEEFTIGVQIENCGSNVPEFVYFELINPPTDITIKEPLFINISQLYYGNSERFLIYHMKASDNALPGTHLIKTRLSYGRDNYFFTKNSNITFEVIGDKAELNIASVKTKPVLPTEGETVELTLRIENTGEGTAKSIRINADHPFKGVKQAFLGSLNLNEDGPAIFTFIADKAGDFKFPVTVSYQDDFGEKQIKTDVEISIMQKESNLKQIIIFASLTVLVLIIIFYFVRKNKSKDRIIHQLLKGNHTNSSDKKS